MSKEYKFVTSASLVNKASKSNQKNHLWYAAVTYYIEPQNRKIKYIRYNDKLTPDGKIPVRKQADFLASSKDSVEEEIAQKVKIINSDIFSSVATAWLKTKKEEIAETTYITYKGYLDSRLIPYFGDMNMAEITLKDVKRFFEEYRNGIDLNNEKPEKTKKVNSMKRYLSVLKQVFQYAVYEEIIDNNVVSLYRLPKKKASENFTGKTLEIDNIKKLLNYFKENDERFYPIIAIAANTGMRRSEVMGLKWKAINLKKHYLEVSHTVVENSKQIRKDGAKNSTSERIIGFTDYEEEIFRKLKEEQDYCRSLYNECYKNPAGGEGYVFVWPNGCLIRPKTVSTHFKNGCKEIGIEEFRLHDLRHSFASNALGNDLLNAYEVMKQLGHSDLSMISEVYTHVTPEEQAKVAEKASMYK